MHSFSGTAEAGHNLLRNRFWKTLNSWQNVVNSSTGLGMVILLQKMAPGTAVMPRKKADTWQDEFTTGRLQYSGQRTHWKTVSIVSCTEYKKGLEMTCINYTSTFQYILLHYILVSSGYVHYNVL
jgi:hypothetical protein